MTSRSEMSDRISLEEYANFHDDAAYLFEDRMVGGYYRTVDIVDPWSVQIAYMYCGSLWGME